MASDSDKASRRSSRPHTGRSVADYRRRQAERQAQLDKLVEAVLVADEHLDGADSNLDGEIAKLETKLDEKIAKLRAEHATKVEQLRSAVASRRDEIDEEWAAAMRELADFASIAEVAFALDVSERQVKVWIKKTATDKPAAAAAAPADPVAEQRPATENPPAAETQPLRDSA
ncbi:hypothetical protein GS486_18080 [Rhodococcus hoagii]|nr:hypothetical protein [Prescottella equi]